MDRTLKCLISSSSEDLHIVEQISNFLIEEGIEPIRWDRGFKPGMTIFENLQNTISEVDFVIALIPSSESNSSKVLENVLFEMGMIIGMGKPLIPLVKNEPNVTLPTDIAGIMYLQYESTNIESSLHHIRNWIDRFLEI